MRLIVTPIALAGLVAAGACSRREEKKPEPPPPAAAETSEPAPASPATTATVPPAVAPPGTLPRSPTPSVKEPEPVPDVSVPLRPLDQQIFALIAKQADAREVKKAFPGTPRVALRLRGAGKVADVEMDLDGDDRLDERWRVESSGAAVRRARVRDGGREDVYNLEGDHWKLVAGSGKSATQEIPAPVPLRPLDKQILAVAGKRGKPTDDATPGKKVRVSLASERGSSKLNRVKVDLDRDGEWDETWWVELPSVRRSVSPRDNGDYSERYRLVDGKWLPQ